MVFVMAFQSPSLGIGMHFSCVWRERQGGLAHSLVCLVMEIESHLQGKVAGFGLPLTRSQSLGAVFLFGAFPRGVVTSPRIE